MKFNQDGLTVDQILRSLWAMIIDGCFAAECVIVDGYKFTSQEGDNVARIKEFARELGLSVWFSCTVKDDHYDKQNIPVPVKDYAELFDVIVVLEPRQDHIELTVSRDRDAEAPERLALRLDPKTLLILED